MDPTAQQAFVDNAGVYLENHRIFELFQQMMTSLITNKPKDPLQHLVSLLEQPSQKLRVFISGPPGSAAAAMAAKASSELGLLVIAVKDLVKEEKGGAAPAAAKLVAAIKERVAKPDAISKGFVIADLPTGKEYVQALNEAGVLCSHFLLLSMPQEAAQERVKIEVKLKSSEEGAKLVSDYYKRIGDVASAMKASITQINGNQAEQKVWEEIKATLARPVPSQAPTLPLRVAVLGPKGAGKATQAAKIANKFGLVPLSTGAILRDALAIGSVGTTKSDAELADKVRPFLRLGALVPDEIIVPLVISRLQQSDCRRQGWVLEGFPRTHAQAEALTKANLQPTRVVLLATASDVVQKRLLNRRFDPLTGASYNTADSPATDSAVAARLVHRDEDKKENVQAVNSAYSANIDELLSYYKPQLRSIDGAKLRDEVAKLVQEFLVGSLSG